MDPEVSVILPTFNERDSLPRVIVEIHESLADISHEIVVVDDDSPDGTWRWVEEQCAHDPGLRLLRRTVNPGLSASVLDGFRVARGGKLIVMDADGQHDPTLLPEICRSLDAQELVVASRYLASGSTGRWTLMRRLASRGATWLARLVLNAPLTDPMSGYFGIRREAFHRVAPSMNPRGFKVLLEIYYRLSRSPGRRRLTYVELPYQFRSRLAGSSKLSGRIAWQYLRMLIALRKEAGPPASAVPTPSEVRTCDRVAALCSLAALLVAALLASFHRVGTYQVETDFYWAYGPQAANLLAGRPYSYTFHPPGYPLLVAGVSFLTGDLFSAAKVLSAIGTGAFVWFTYLLVKALFDARRALATALLTFAAIVPFSFLAATDVVGATLMLLPSWAILRRSALTSRACLSAGMLAGAAYLVRTNSIAVVGGVAISLLLGISAPRRPRRRLADCSIFLFGVLLTTAPWLAINWARQGQPFASTSYLQVAAHFYLPGGEVNSITSLQQASQQFGSLWEVLSYQPEHLLLTFAEDTLYSHPRSLILSVLPGPAAILAGLGLFWLVRSANRRLLAWFIPSALGYLLLGLANFQARFYIFLFPALLLLVVAGIFQLALAANRLTRSWSEAKVGWPLVAILVVMFGARSVEEARTVFREEPLQLLRIADVLRARSSPEDAMISRKPHLAFLAGLNLVPFPLATTAEELLAAAVSSGARYVTYSDLEAEMWPGLKSLADPTRLPEDFRLIVRDDPTNTLVYEIRPVADRGAPPTRGGPHPVDRIPARIWLALLLAGALLGFPLVIEHTRRGAGGTNIGDHGAS